MTYEEIRTLEPKATVYRPSTHSLEIWRPIIVLYGRSPIAGMYPFIGERDGEIWYSIGGVGSTAKDFVAAGMRGPFTDLGVAYTSFRLEAG